MSKTLRRLVSDYKNMLKSKSHDIKYFTAGPVINKTMGRDGEPVDEEDYYHWTGIINGPEETPYEGGKFKINIQFPSKYPMEPPVIKFISNIYHPNIRNGVICLNILKNEWTGCTTIGGVLLSLYLLLQQPNFNDPLNHEASAMHKMDPVKYFEIARKITNECA